MKTLKKPIVPTAGSREAFRETSHETFELQENVHADPVLAPAIHEDGRTAPAKILVISDQPDRRSDLRKELQAAHYDVIAAENEAEGVNLAATIRPDLILLDIKIPTMDGAGTGEK
jgi:PleD family two-component response regulator